MLSELRHIGYALAAVVCVSLWAYVEMHLPPSTQPTSSESRLVSVEREVQGVVQALDAFSIARNSVAPIYQQPAISVVREIPGTKGLTDAEIGLILSHLKPTTREVITASSKFVGPSPAPLPSAVPGLSAQEIQAIYEADRAATSSVLADPATHIATTVKVSQEEVQPTRVGSVVSSLGAGLDVSVVRTHHFEMNVGGIVRGVHISPIFQPAWLIPHTSVAVGPAFTFDRGLKAGLSASIHF